MLKPDTLIEHYLNWKEPQKIIAVVYNTKTHQDVDLEFWMVNKGQNLPLKYCNYDKDGVYEEGTLRAYQRFFSHYNIASSEVTRALSEAIKRFPTSIVLTCALNRFIYHKNREFMQFCNQPDTIIITKGDKGVYDLHKSDWNRFWESKGSPYRFVIVEKRKVIV